MAADPMLGVVAEEQAVLDAVVPGLRASQDAEAAEGRAVIEALRVAHAAWKDAVGDEVQRELTGEALTEATRRKAAHEAARRTREIPLSSPYFGRLVTEEPTRSVQVLIGKVGATVGTGAGRITIVDWRDAPISRLYYEYAEGEAFEETIQGRARAGVIRRKRRVDIHDGVLREIEAGGQVYRRGVDARWAHKGEERREIQDDHRLPDIVSLITTEQFRVIARPEAGVVLLRGRAGSGKTTVALHRVAWLHFQQPERFLPEKMLVVMFNKALQTYISRVLPDLGVNGVSVETFHGLAVRMLRQASLEPRFRGGTPVAVGRLKRHPAMVALLDAALRRLGDQSAAWLADRLGDDARAALDATPGHGLARLVAWRRANGAPPGWTKLRGRLLDHVLDVRRLFADEATWRAALPPALHKDAAAAHAHNLENEAAGALDFEDAALVLRIGQLKAALDPELSCPWAGMFRHIVIDEAQDLSTHEIEAIVGAADRFRSVTIAGDPAQKILADAQFEGFEAMLSRLSGKMEASLDVLSVGYRSPRPVMELAMKALGTNEPARAARDGEPVDWFEGEGAVARAIAAVRAWREAHPGALVAVLSKRKNAADDWAAALLAAGVPGVRRADRGNFGFEPGIVVSNVHQVKGLEFDGVLLVEPADFGGYDRHLLHVAITRAAERLWVVATRGRGVLG